MNRQRLVMHLPFVAVLGLALCACSSGSGDVEGAWGSSEGGQPQLELNEDGTLNGTDGCNRFSGSWELEDGVISFGEVASTLMACEDVDTWLNGLSTATVDGDILRVLDVSEAEIGTLERG